MRWYDVHLFALIMLASIGCAIGAVEAMPDDQTRVEAVARDGPDVPTIRVPSGPMLPPPSSDVAVKLSADTLYVIDADVPVRVLSSPPGLVRITKEQGPIRIRGRFVDGTGKPETRTYAGKWVYFVEPVQSGRVELLIVPTGEAKADDSDIIRRTLDVDAGDGPRPPPPDPKPPTPPDPVNPAPIPTDGFRVLMVYETADLAKYPPGQSAVLHSNAVRTFLNSKCVVGPDGKTFEWRQYDKDVDLKNESKLWRDAMARPRKSLPWIIVSNGKTGYEGPLPDSVDAVIELLKKY